MLKNARKIDIETIVLLAILILLTLVYLVPFVWLVLNSLKTNTELFSRPVVWFPNPPQWGNYVRAITDFPFFLYLRNTVTIIVFHTIGALISNSLVAYGFSRIQWPGRDKVFILVLLGIMLPFQVVMIPTFLLYQQLGFMGTLLPLIVHAYFGNPFFIFLLRQFFVGIPKEITESAKIDGANELIVYWKLILPLAKPALATIVIFSFMNNWNDFIGPLIYLTETRLYTLAIGIQQIMDRNDPRWSILLPAGVIMTTPILVIFFVLQKYFIQGISLSGIKG